MCSTSDYLLFSTVIHRGGRSGGGGGEGIHLVTKNSICSLFKEIQTKQYVHPHIVLLNEIPWLTDLLSLPVLVDGYHKKVKFNSLPSTRIILELSRHVYLHVHLKAITTHVTLL